MSTGRLKSAIPVLPVSDVPKAVAFYRARLGFIRSFELGDYAGLTRGPIEIHLDGSQPGATPATARIAVSGVDELYAELEPQGVIHPSEPLETKPFGMRQFSVLDADGNRLTFAEPVTAAAEAPARRRFLITFTHVEGEAQKLDREGIERAIQRHGEWQREIDALERSSLCYFAPPAEARTVRLHRDGRLEVTEGPLHPGPESPGGFTIVEADSLEDAVEMAKRHRWLVGSNEVRELRAPPQLRTWIRS